MRLLFAAAAPSPAEPPSLTHRVPALTPLQACARHARKSGELSGEGMHLAKLAIHELSINMMGKLDNLASDPALFSR